MLVLGFSVDFQSIYIGVCWVIHHAWGLVSAVTGGSGQWQPWEHSGFHL